MKKILIPFLLCVSVFLGVVIVFCDTANAAINLIDKITPKNGAFQGLVDSSQTLTNTTNFNVLLSTSDTDVQKSLETIDDKAVKLDPSSQQSGAINVASGTIGDLSADVLHASSATVYEYWSLSDNGTGMANLYMDNLFGGPHSVRLQHRVAGSPGLTISFDVAPNGIYFQTSPSVDDKALGILGSDKSVHAYYNLTAGSITVNNVKSASCLSTDSNGNLQAGSCSSGGTSTSTVVAGSGLQQSISGSTITLSIGQLVQTSTITASSATIANLTVTTLTVAGSGDWPVMVPPSGTNYRIAGSSTALTVGQMVVALSTNGALGTQPIPTGGSSSSGTVIASPQYQVAVYSVSGTSNVVTGSPMLTIQDGTMTFTNVHTWQMVGLDSTTFSKVYFDYSGSTVTAPILTAVPKITMADGTFFTSTSTLGGSGSGDVVLTSTTFMGGTTFYGEIHFPNKSTFTLTNINLEVTKLSVIGSTSNVYAMTVSTAQNGPYFVGVTTTGHLMSGGTTPTLSSCGTAPAIVGDDNAFTFTVGTSTGSCNVSFASIYASTPVCIPIQRTPSVTNMMGYVVTTSSISFTRTTFDSQVVDVHCQGRM